MTTIYLIRHAEAEGNLYRNVQGHFDSYLTARGKLQVNALAERFKDIQIDALYSSDLRRTCETAGAILRYHELELHTTPRLREICMGRFEGQSFGDMRHADNEQMDNFNNDPENWVEPTAEPYLDCMSRMISVITEIAEANDGKTVAAVSHGMALRSFLSYVLHIKSSEVRTALPHGDNTAVSLLHYENGVFTAEYYNDNSHLPEGVSLFAEQTWWKIEAGGYDDQNLRYEPIDPRENEELYISCYSDSWRSVHGSLKGFSPAPYYRAACADFAEDPRSVLGVYQGDKFVGLIELDMNRGRHANYGWISLVWLKEEARGKGFGIQPLGMAITIYERLGRSAVRLYVSSANERAIAFYKKYGFEVLSTAPGVCAPLYLMEKKFE